MLKEPWRCEADAGSEEWRAALRSMAKIGVDDIHTLRREVNRRLVPAEKLREITEAAQKAGRLPATPPWANADEACRIPHGETDLRRLAARILDYAALTELLLDLFPLEEEHQEACASLLERGLGSAAALLG